MKAFVVVVFDGTVTALQMIRFGEILTKVSTFSKSCAIFLGFN